jgi:WD40 repeat protein
MDFGDPHAVLWDVETGKKREELGWVLGNTGNEKGFYVRDAAFSPDGRWLALSIVHSPNGDHNFRRTYVNTHLAYRRLTLWKVGTALAEDYPVSYFAPDDTIHIGEDIRCLTFSHDGRRVLGSCLHHSLPRLKLLVVDVATKQRVNAELPYRLFPARHLAVSPVDSVVALGCEQGIALFDDQELRLIHLFERPVQDGRRGYYSDPRTAFTPDGNKLVVLEFSGTVTVYDVAPYLVEVRQRQAKTSKKMEEGAAP